MEHANLRTRVSGQKAGSFYRQLRCPHSANWLALLYMGLAPSRRHAGVIKPISLLDLAEQIALPTEGMKHQLAYVMHLLANGSVSRVSVENLSPEQLHALRHASQIWPGFRDFCFSCFVKLPRVQDRRQCVACKRSLYCGRECQKM